MADSAVVDALREFFARDPHGCTAVYLFGSRAREDYRADSDVDVAVLWEQEPENALDAMGFRLAGELADLLGREVDVVVLKSASPELCHIVLSAHCLILDSDQAARARFEAAARKAYWDVRPILLRYRKLAS